jgi:hypothetical protein
MKTKRCGMCGSTVKSCNVCNAQITGVYSGAIIHDPDMHWGLNYEVTACGRKIGYDPSLQGNTNIKHYVNTPEKAAKWGINLTCPKCIEEHNKRDA